MHLGLVILSTAFTMSSLKDLVELGKQFGYEGDTLRKFVQEEQARERDQRVEERTREKGNAELQIAFEREKIGWEREKIELEKQAEREKIELEKQAEREKIVFEREKMVFKEKKLELEKQAEKERIGWEREAEREKLKGEKLAKLEAIEVEDRNMEKDHTRKCRWI